MKVCIFGSREIDKNLCDIDSIIEESGFNISEVVCGKAVGADLLGEWWADKNNIKIAEFPADWRKFGRSAGSIRNKIMHDYCDAGIALWDGQSLGTANMIENFKVSEKPLFIKILDVAKLFGCKVCLKQADVFVFGSNLEGIHGKGSALHARLRHGAMFNHGFGMQGSSFAIPTKDEFLKVLPLVKIKEKVDIFLKFAEKNKHIKFYITQIGTGLAKIDEFEMIAMFNNAPENCVFCDRWAYLLGRRLF